VQNPWQGSVYLIPAAVHAQTLYIKKFRQMSHPKLIILSILLGFSLTAKGQLKVNPQDSVDIKNQIEDFYSWYAGLIKNKELNKQFNPTFVRLRNGMTTLDFKNYKEGLKKYGFTNDFVEKKVNDYKPCVDNLKSIPFDSLNGFELDELEKYKM
jgi:hypothetical protein